MTLTVPPVVPAKIPSSPLFALTLSLTVTLMVWVAVLTFSRAERAAEVIALRDFNSLKLRRQSAVPTGAIFLLMLVRIPVRFTAIYHPWYPKPRDSSVALGCVRCSGPTIVFFHMTSAVLKCASASTPHHDNRWTALTPCDS